MRFKYFLMIGFILFFISIGAACASDNATECDVMCEDVSSDDVLSERDDQEIVIHEEGWEEDDYEIINVYSSKELSGNITVSIDDVQYYNGDISKCKRYVDVPPEDSYYYITQKQLSPNLGIGKYNLTVSYNNHVKSGIFTVANMIEIQENILDDSNDYSICVIHDSEPLNGTVRITLDGIQYYSMKFHGYDDEDCSILWSDLNLPKGFKYGTYDVKVTYKKSNGKTYVNEAKVKYDYNFYLGLYFTTTASVYPATSFRTDVTFYITLPADAKNKVSIKFNGEKYSVALKKGEAKYTIKDVKLDVGEYEAYATYSDSKYPKRTVNDSFAVMPSLEWPAEMSVGQDEYLHIVCPKNSEGTATFYQGKYVSDDDDDQWLVVTKKLGTAKIVDGHAAFSLKSLPKGYQHFYVNYTINGFNGDYGEIHIDVVENSKGFSSSLSADKIRIGKTATLTVKGPSGSGKVKIYLDNMLYKKASLSSGKIKHTFYGLKVGTHKIEVFYQKSKKSYSKTHYVVVKPHSIKLSLQDVKVKKSAKSLKIKVKLKVDGKKAKYKNIKLKFNKIAFKAKTNKKGVAKFTITKKVLKKLKVGKEVTYKAAYGGKSIKKIVKVKR